MFYSNMNCHSPADLKIALYYSNGPTFGRTAYSSTKFGTLSREYLSFKSLMFEIFFHLLMSYEIFARMLLFGRVSLYILVHIIAVYMSLLYSCQLC